MNKKLGMAVAGAVMAFGATAANAGITIPAGDWTIDIGGNVNAYYTNTKFEGDLDVYDENRSSTIQTGLLPSAIGIGGKTRQNDLDIAFQFTFFTGSDSGNGGSAGNNTLNIRQAYMTFGDASWGTIKAGRDLGIFGSDAILSDMTLLGVGVGAGGGGSSTLGRIGSGYMYADWVGQISYHSPNWNGFSFAVGVREPWTNRSIYDDGTDASASNSAIRNDMGFEGKVSYEWAGDVAGKVWAGFITQKHDLDTSSGEFINSDFADPDHWVHHSDDYTSRGWDIGAKVSFSGLSLVGYYYDGKGLSGDQDIFSGLMFRATDKTDDNGGYVQAMYALPGIGTKIGASYGVSKSQYRSSTIEDSDGKEFENKSWIVGVYHPLTKSLNLVAEYTDQDLENIYGVDNLDLERKTLSLGAIMFF